MKEDAYGSYYSARHTVDIVNRGNLLSVHTSSGPCAYSHNALHVCFTFIALIITQ